MLQIKSFFHAGSNTLSYVVADMNENVCAIIDPVLDFDIVSGKTSTTSVEGIVEFVQSNNLSVEWILETHAHADHLSSAQFIKGQLGGQIAIGDGIRQVQSHFAPIFNLDIDTNGSQFDRLLKDGERLALGTHEIRVIHTPGHTADSLTYFVDGNAFVGDTLFMHDSGSARCDFPGGNAVDLYHSIQKIYALGDDVNLYMCHDYMPNGRELIFKTTVAEQKKNNIQIKQGTSVEEYVSIRNARDATLGLPKLIIPSIQVNITAGHLPQPESNDKRYIKIPLDVLK